MSFSTSLHLDADPDQRENQINAFQSCHDEWQECKQKLLSIQNETELVMLTEDDTMQLLGEEYNNINVDGNVTLESLAHSLFRPGMRYVGSICIPSLGPSLSDNEDEDSDVAQQAGIGEKEPYELIILETEKDEFGNDFVLGSHTAYGDTQCVHVDFGIREANNTQNSDQVLDIAYEDEETCIRGVWNPMKCCLEGCVRQRLQANDGAFHSSDDVSHVFTLYPCTNELPMGRRNGMLQTSFHDDLFSTKTRAMVKLRNVTYVKENKCASTYIDLFKSVGLKIEMEDLARLHVTVEESDDESASVESLRRLRGSNWGDLSQNCVMKLEKTCARFRYMASLLDKAIFDTDDDKEAFFDNWKEAGFCLATAHDEWDMCNGHIARLTPVAYVLSHSQDNLIIKLHEMVYKATRISQNYGNLESSWRRAKARKSIDFLKQFEVSCNEAPPQCACSICFEELGSEDLIYRLPCSHCYHGPCLQQWLHNNVTCPTCRSSVS